MISILIIGGWKRLYGYALKSGLRVLVLNPSDNSVVSSDEVHKIYTCAEDESSIIDKAIHISKVEGFDAVFSFQEKYLTVAAKILKILGKKGNDIEQVNLTRDKLAMRKLLENTQLGNCQFYQITGVASIDRDVIKKIKYPCILKPRFGAGSYSVHLINNLNELKALVDELFSGLEKTLDSKKEYLLEDFKIGREFSIETLSFGGKHSVIAITEKKLTPMPNFVEVGHITPAQLSIENKKKLEESCLEFLSIINHQIGPAHTEVILSNDNRSVSIIESHTRAGGDYIYDLVEYSTGINLFYETFLMLADENGYEFPPKKSKLGVAGIHFFQITPGVLVQIDGIEKAKSVEGVKRIEMLISIGEKIKNFENSDDRNGFVISINKNRDKLDNAISEVLDTIKFKISCNEQ